MTKKVRAGIIGFGRMGRRHLEAYLKNPQTEIGACCDVNPDALKFLDAREIDCNRYTDWREMLRDESFDVLSVVTNGPTHAEITIEAAKAGIRRIICEKPMATSIKDAKRMIDATEESGIRLVINYSRRLSASYRKLKDSLREGIIGQLCEIRCVCGGGLLACNGSHFLDLMYFLFDSEPTSVVGFVDKKGTPNPRGAQYTDPGAFGLVTFGHRMRGFLDMYEDLGIPPRIEVVGSVGRAIIVESSDTWQIESRQGKDRLEPLGRYDLPLKSSPFQVEPLDATQLTGKIISEVLGDGPIVCSRENGLAALEMVMGFHASDQMANTPVPIPLPSKFEEMTINFT
ncbi:MAG: Gfo/Idh/MocA family oxidoreductase [Candidatus Bathyarchaeia archaeon]